MFSSIRIGLVSDQPIFRTGLTEALKVSENFTVVAHGQTAEDAFRMASDATLDILLLEIEIPGLGTGAVRALCGAKASTKVEVERYGVRSNAVTMFTTMSSPALFTANASGAGQGAIVNQEGSVNGQDTPAEKGSVVILYLTGEGQTDPGGVDGLLALSALPKPQMPVRVQIDGQNAEILYAGAAPGMVSGVMQVNVKVPGGAASGSVQVQVTVGGATSPSGVTLVVK